jgi:hypothetical protein
MIADGAGIGKPLQRWATGWNAGKDFSLLHSDHSGSGSHSDSYAMDTVGYFLRI